MYYKCEIQVEKQQPIKVQQVTPLHGKQVMRHQNEWNKSTINKTEKIHQHTA